MNLPIQQSLFPVRDSLQVVQQEALARLPITSENELISILQTQQNTLLELIRRAKESNHDF